MSESKHTPGPWVLETAETYTVRGQDEGGIAQLKWLRGRHGMGGRRPDEEVMANAHLIAAAPNLLAALKLVVAQIEDYERVNNLAPNPGRKHCWDSVALAHDAIAIAEGRAP